MGEVWSCRRTPFLDLASRLASVQPTSGSCASIRRGLWRYARFGVVDFEGISEGLQVFRPIVIA